MKVLFFAVLSPEGGGSSSSVKQEAPATPPEEEAEGLVMAQSHGGTRVMAKPQPKEEDPDDDPLHGNPLAELSFGWPEDSDD